MEKLDLHGTRLAEARQKVIGFVEQYWDTGTELKIITGHSSAMKNEVIIVLEEYKLGYVVGDHFKLNTGFITAFIATAV